MVSLVVSMFGGGYIAGSLLTGAFFVFIVTLAITVTVMTVANAIRKFVGVDRSSPS